jgi:hypothetical protein
MQARGYVTVEQVEKEFSWSTGRAIDALETLLKVNTASEFLFTLAIYMDNSRPEREDNPLCLDASYVGTHKYSLERQQYCDFVGLYDASYVGISDF